MPLARLVWPDTLSSSDGAGGSGRQRNMERSILGACIAASLVSASVDARAQDAVNTQSPAVQARRQTPGESQPADASMGAEAHLLDERAPLQRASEVAAPGAETPGSSQRTAGLVIAGAGVAGTLFGLTAAVVAKVKYDKAACGGPECMSAGLDEFRDSQRWAMMSGISLVGGTLLGGVGAVLFFTAPKRTGAIAIGPAAVGTGFAVSGSF